MKEKRINSSKRRRILHVLKTWKTWKEHNADHCSSDDFLQRISNIIGVEK